MFETIHSPEDVGLTVAICLAARDAATSTGIATIVGPEASRNEIGGDLVGAITGRRPPIKGLNPELRLKVATLAVVRLLE